MILSENVLLDWLSFTLPYSDVSMDRAQSIAPAELSNEGNFGLYGYVSGFKISGGGRIMYNSDRQDMGIHVILPASSLALLDFRPLQLLNLIRDWGGKITRLDLAFDDFEGLLDIDEMHAKLLSGHVQTRYRRVARTSGANLGSDEKTGDTVNIGSRKSASFVRIYDKLLERQAKNADVPDGVTHWIRVEVELKGDKADAVSEILGNTALSSSVSAGAEAAKLLYGLLDFKDEDPDDSNKSRWQTAEWWLTFVRVNTKRSVSLPKIERSIERSKKWINNTVSSTLAMIVLSRDDDNGLSGFDFIVQAIVRGERKLAPQQKRILEDYNRQQQEKFIVL